jgi:hypothetical protein
VQAIAIIEKFERLLGRDRAAPKRETHGLDICLPKPGT